MNSIYKELKLEKSVSSYMDSTIGRGYMVLGILLHLEADILCHRAKVDINMLTDNGKECIDWYGDACWNSRIYTGNFEPGGWQRCVNYVKENGSMPVARLKERLKEMVTVYPKGKAYTVKNNRAYEDNPYWYSNRYAASVYQVKSTVEDMKYRKDYTNCYVFDDCGVSLYKDEFKKKFDGREWYVD